MKLLRLFVSFCLLITLQQSLLSARETQKYKAEITVPILENDTVYARNNAFQSLQRLILTAAITDLIGQDLFSEYRYSILRSKSIKPSKFLVSAKVLDEFSNDKKFTMKLEGIIQTSTLAEELRKLNLVLKNDPMVPVTVMVESGLKIGRQDLSERLGLLHINISDFKKVDISDFLPEERFTGNFAERLFSLNGGSKVVYLIDSIPAEEPGFIKAIRTQIFRRADYAVISAFQLDLPNPLAAGQIDPATLGRLNRLFTISSLEMGLYNEGLDATVILEVEGLIDPFNRSEFEQKVLKKNRSIKSYTLTQISLNKSRYRIQSRVGLKELASIFEKKHPYFYFIVEQVNSNTIQIESFYRYVDQAPEVDVWEPNQRIMGLIADSLGEEFMANDLTSNDLILQPTVQNRFIPKFVEKEPNNNSQHLNRIPPSTQILGNISSRADEDVFQLTRDVNSSTLVVEWIRIGKTTLSPQLRLYDHQFNVINNYNLVGRQNKLRFSYTFKESAPQKVFLRVTDKVGYIQGETGGFKTFYYLLKYYWQTES